MTVKVADLVKEVLPWAPGCSGPLARRELIRSAQRFCRATFAAVVESGPFTIAATKGELDLNDYAGPYMRGIRAMDVVVDGVQLVPVTERDINRARIFGDPMQPKSDIVRNYYMLDEHRLRVYPYPDSQRTALISLAVMPTDRAVNLPDVLGIQWRDAIVGGAMQSICSQPGEPYTSMDHAALGSRMYASGVNMARVDVNRSYSADISVRSRPFA